MPSPTTQYVAYQKLTSPPVAPVVGGYHGATSIYRFDSMENATAISHARYSDGGMFNRLRRARVTSSPTLRRKVKKLMGYMPRSTTISVSFSPELCTAVVAYRS